MSTLLEEHHGILEVFGPHLVYQSPQFAQSVLVIALRNNDHLGVEAETHFHLLIEGRISEEEEFERTRIHTDERQRLVSIGRVHSLLWLPHVSIHDIGRFHTFVKQRKLVARIDIVGQEFAHFSRAVEAFADNHGCIRSADVEHGASGAALRPNVVEAWKSHTRNKGVARTAYHMGGQLIGHGDFVLGSFAQTNADSVTNTVGEKCANTCCTLDAAVLAFTGLRHAEMQREIHPLCLHDGA